MLWVFSPAHSGVLFSSVVLSCWYYKLLVHAVCGATFLILTVKVLEHQRTNCQSVLVLFMLYKIRSNWMHPSCSTCDNVCYSCCFGLSLLFIFFKVLIQYWICFIWKKYFFICASSFLEFHSTTGLQYLLQHLWNVLGDTVCWWWPGGFKSWVNASFYLAYLLSFFDVHFWCLSLRRQWMSNLCRAGLVR